MTRLMLAASAALLLAACGGGVEAQTPAAGAPVATDPPNAKGQTPAFPGQTRAPEVKANVAYKVTTAAKGLEKPWGLAFLPDGALLITEKPGRLRLLENGKLSAPIPGLPAIDPRDQGGLFGLALSPTFATDGLVYMSFAEVRDGLTHTAVARAKLVRDAGGPKLTDTQVIWRQSPTFDSTKHYGGRLLFGRDGTLFVTTGERSVVPGRLQAQRLDGDLGKMIRINADGSIPKDNPFVGQPGAKPEIWSIGHRNIQAATLDPRTGDLWEVEHGTRGGDELNLVEKGKDYGWPTIAYGIEYQGGPITGNITQKAGMEQPVYYWDPVIAPSGMTFYEADLFPAWKGSLFVGGLKATALVRLTLDGKKVTGEERLLTELGERIRDVVVGPDGALYVATDNAHGRVLKISPK